MPETFGIWCLLLPSIPPSNLNPPSSIVIHPDLKHVYMLRENALPAHYILPHIS